MDMTTIRAVAFWALLIGSAAVGFAVVGTASLMVGNGAAIRNGLILWIVATVLCSTGMHFALKRRSAWASAGLVPVPALAAVFSAHYVMGA
jgi:lysylphosphatidylglycerol synthetase-like protein (DUF2156 family)